ncbi:nucleotidyltransferase family protein [Microbulbifer spongiae]|uniref:Nucleotidyltransferase family protein n=1 Tax=Microbulbifer spongiae TaxID=2944933 RepID=A0ABY9EDE3_9GAMM|nr:nucleotidyltransferase family protein [Microbulbifer sp. MI-G]WKD50073.1 nucleotidyltransferase family protein [Microbulbifer sp. MI-G]
MKKFSLERTKQPAKRLLIALLAAGASRRFDGIKLQAAIGVINRNGLVKSQPLLLQTLDKLDQLTTKQSTGSTIELVVILGEHREVLAKLLPPDVNQRMNPYWKSGIASSIKTAVVEAEVIQADGLLIALADHIGVTVGDYQQLIAAWQSSGQTCCAQYQNSFGTPAIFNASDFGYLARLDGDIGAKSLLKKRSAHNALTVINIEGITMDIDSKADLEKWQQLIAENLA